MSYRSRRLGAAVVVLMVSAVACSSSAQRPRAAEPSVAPALDRPAVGRVLRLPVGSDPEGVVADHRTHTVVVGLRDPARIALVDTRTLDVTIRASPGRVRHLVLLKPGGPVVLPAELLDEVFELALPSGRVTRAIPVLRHPHNAAVVGDDLWVVDEFSAATSVIGPDGKVVATLSGPEQPGGVATASGTVGVTDVLGARMYFYDATSRVAEGSIPLGDGPTHAVAVGSGFVVAADTRGSALLLVDMSRRAVVSRLAVPGGPYGLAADPARGLVWTTLTASNQLVEVQVQGDRLVRRSTLPTVRQPNTVAVDPVSGCRYVAGVRPARLQVIC